MTTDNELRALASAATPGPWAWNCYGDLDMAERDDCSVITCDAENDRVDVAPEDARYIAAASPDRIVALLDALDAMTKDRDEWRTAAASKARLHLDVRDLERKLESSLDTSERVDRDLQAALDRVQQLEAALMEAAEVIVDIDRGGNYGDYAGELATLATGAGR